MPQPKLHASHAARQAVYRKRQEEARSVALRQKGLPPMPAIPSMPGAKRWNAAVRMAQALLEQTADEMRYYYDERSEEWQEGERGDEHQERLDALDSLIGDFDALA